MNFKSLKKNEKQGKQECKNRHTLFLPIKNHKECKNKVVFIIFLQNVNKVLDFNFTL